MVDLFHNLYLGCLAGAGVYLFISIILFLRFDIRGAFGVLTGHRAKKEIRRLEKKDSNDHILKHAEEPSIRKVKGITGITITRKLEDGSEEVTKLLPMEEGEKTTLLNHEKSTFYIEREIMFIHTNEVIE
jgi:hypothetical protein